MYKAVTTSFFLIAFQTLSSAQSLDIAGLSVGMNPKDTISRVREINSNLKESFIKERDFTYGIFFSPTNSDRSDRFIAYINDAGLTWAITRFQELESGNRFTKEILEESLIKKYGKTSFIITDDPPGFTKANAPSVLIGAFPFTWEWQLKKDNTLFIGEPKQGPCHGLLLTKAYWNQSPSNANITKDEVLIMRPSMPSMSRIPLDSASVLEFFPKDCGTKITARAWIDRDNFVTKYSISIFDGRSMRLQAEKRQEKHNLETETNMNRDKTNKPNI